MVFNKNMLEQLITIFSSESFMSSVAGNIDVLAGLFNKYLSGLGNIRMASIILMLLAFVMFLFLIIVLYVKSIIAFLKTETGSSKKGSATKISEDWEEEEEEDEEEEEKEEKPVQRKDGK